MERQCKICGTKFSTRFRTKKYCRPLCKKLALQNRNEKKSQTKNTVQKSERKNNTTIPALKVVKGDLFDTLKRLQRTRDFLIFSQAIFWNDKNWTEAQQLEYCNLIADYFIGSKDNDYTFKHLVQRACLAKQWLDEKPYRQLPEPEEWFNSNCLDGFSFTQALYDKVKTQRKTIPSYKYAISLLAEAVLRFSEEKNLLDFYSYRDQFIKLQQKDILQMYMNAVIHIQFLTF